LFAVIDKDQELVCVAVIASAFIVVVIAVVMATAMRAVSVSLKVSPLFFLSVCAD
jgi:hypothetical protein